MFGCGDKSSIISESVEEIRININLARAKPDNTTWSLINMGEGYHRGAPNIFLSTLTLLIQ
jgi:hypothetical protein